MVYTKILCLSTINASTTAFTLLGSAAAINIIIPKHQGSNIVLCEE